MSVIKKEIIMVFFIACFIIGCSSKNIDNKSTKSFEQNDETLKVSELFYKEIPVPSKATVKEDSLVITGKNPDEIIKEYLTTLTDNGWNLITSSGTKRFYEKEINNKKIIISVLSLQEGGPQEKTIETTIQFQFSKNPDEKKNKS